MDRRDLEPLLASKIFKDCSLADLKQIANECQMTARSYHVDEAVFVDGSEFVKTGFVLSGQVHVVSESPSGDRSIIEVVNPGGTFAEVVNCMSIKRPPVSVIVTKPSRIAFIDLRKLLQVQHLSSSQVFNKELIRLFAGPSANLIELLAHKCMRLRTKVEILSQRSIRAKLICYIDHSLRQKGIDPHGFQMSYPIKLDLDFNREELSDFLCVNRSALSRELAAMKAEGLLDFKRSEIVILGPLC